MDSILHKIGARYDPSGSEFIVWAPLAERIELVVGLPGGPAEENASGKPASSHDMTREEGGYWKIILPLPAGTRYKFWLDGKDLCPDPASLSQPEGVHGPSELLDRNVFPWDDETWRGMPLCNMIIYELHVGAFSGTHDFEGIINKLDYFVELGVNTLELMPLGQFAGERNWGYDGVNLFAIQHSYGGAEGFQRLVNAAHAKGIAIIVDVVYNHFGPEGCYLGNFGPYLTDKHHTPWGKAVNFDDEWSDGVRNYFLQNLCMWLEEYHVDGLRLDAVHAIKDAGAVHIVQQLKELALEIEESSKCIKVLVAEIDLNDPRYIRPVEKGGYGLDGQWVDEFHHALRAYITGDRSSYYEDFGELSQLEAAFAHTYVYNGIYSPHRKRVFGGNATQSPFSQFIVFSQNHDQVGNRARGERLTDHLSFEQLKLVAATVLLSPYVPLLFMGEEYGEKAPFQYFVDFSDPALIEMVRKGRREEFAGFVGVGRSLAETRDPEEDDVEEDEIPDPESETTFTRSLLGWDQREDQAAALLRFYKYLIAFRKTRPAMQGMTREDFVLLPGGKDILRFERKILNDHLYVWLHFGSQKTTVCNDTGFALRKVVDSASDEWLGAAAVGWGEIGGTMGMSNPGGTGGPEEIEEGGRFELAPHSVQVFEKK